VRNGVGGRRRQAQLHDVLDRDGRDREGGAFLPASTSGRAFLRRLRLGRHQRSIGQEDFILSVTDQLKQSRSSSISILFFFVVFCFYTQYIHHF
jgi:hypothetical protein